MREGQALSKTEFYLKTDKGLWIRSRADYSTGAIVMDLHQKVVFQNGFGVVLDEHGNELSKFKAASSPIPDEWLECARISMDDKGFRTFMHRALNAGIDLEELNLAIMRHAVRLSAFGWGNAIGETLDWFRDPLNAACLVESSYKVEKSRGSFGGLEGLFFTPSVDDWHEVAEKGVLCSFMYDGRAVEERFPLTEVILFCSPEEKDAS